MNKTRRFLRSVTGAVVPEARGAHMPELAAELRLLAASLESEPPVGGDELVDYARIVVAARAELDRAIGAPWLTDPALEVLLDRFMSEQAGAASGHETALAAVPHTAQRWIVLMEQAGLMATDAGGARLTEKGHEAVSRYLTALSSHRPVDHRPDRVAR